MENTLKRSRSDKKIFGVIGGLAQFFKIDSTLLRVIFIFLLIITGLVPLTIFYLLAALIMPTEN